MIGNNILSIKNKLFLVVFIAAVIIIFFLGNTVIVKVNSLFTSAITSIFKVEGILVTGRQKTNIENLFKAINIEHGSSILDSNLQSIKNNVRELPWVKNVIIKRQLPDTIVVNLQEYTAFATWKNNDRYILITQDGTVIKVAENINITAPIVIGQNAPKHIKAFSKELMQVPSLASKIHTVERIGGRRWNIVLNAGEGFITVKLPQEAVGAALKNLLVLNSKYKILNRGLSQIDLRIPEQITVKLRSTKEQLNNQEIKNQSQSIKVPNTLVKGIIKDV